MQRLIRIDAPAAPYPTGPCAVDLPESSTRGTTVPAWTGKQDRMTGNHKRLRSRSDDTAPAKTTRSAACDDPVLRPLPASLGRGRSEMQVGVV